MAQPDPSPTPTGGAPDSNLPTAPGPRWLALLRAFLWFRRDPLPYLRWLVETYGDVARTGLPPVVIHTLGHPDHVRRVLVERMDNYPKGDLLDLLAPVLGRGLLRSEGELWQRQRKALGPAFSREIVESYFPVIREEASRLAASWMERPEGPVNISRAMKGLTLRILSRALFDADLAGWELQVEKAVETVDETVSRYLKGTPPLPSWIPTRRNRRFAAAVRDLDQVVDQVLEQADRPGGEEAPMRDPVRGSRRSEEGSMPEALLRDEVRTLIIAGHDTTATTLAWLLDFLARDLELQDRVRGEIQEHAGAMEKGWEGLAGLDLARRVLQETMRLRPPAWMLMRRVKEEDAVGGYRIPKGSYVNLPVWALHHDPRWWPDPERFDPDRFLPEAAKDRPTYAYLPFGAGPRVCIGKHLAEGEILLALAELLPRVEFLPEGPGPALEAWLTLRPKPQIRLGVRPVAG